MYQQIVQKGIRPLKSAALKPAHCATMASNTIQTPQGLKRNYNSNAYVIKEEVVDGVFGDKKRFFGGLEVYDMDDKNIPEHYIKDLHKDPKAKKLYLNEPLAPVSKDTKIDPDQYTMEDMEELKKKGVRTTVEEADYYKKKYTHLQTRDILQQGITIEMPVLPQVIPDKPFDQMSASEFKNYASEQLTRRMMASKVKIPKPRIDETGKIYKEAVMNANAYEVDELIMKSKKETQNLKEMLRTKNIDDIARAEWEAVLSLEDQLKKLIEDEDKLYEPIKPDAPSMKSVLLKFSAVFITAFIVLSLATPGTRALVWKPLIAKLKGEQ